MPDRQHVGVYPGTFDPVTNGHIDIVARAATLVHRLVIGVAENAGKGPLFPLEERVELVRAETAHPFQTPEPTTCGIPGHDQPGQELIAALMRVEDDPFHWVLEGRCGFAAGFDYRSGR